MAIFNSVRKLPGQYSSWKACRLEFMHNLNIVRIISWIDFLKFHNIHRNFRYNYNMKNHSVGISGKMKRYWRYRVINIFSFFNEVSSKIFTNTITVINLFIIKIKWSVFPIFLDVVSWPLWEPTSQGSPHLQTQIQAVPVLSSLYPSLISF